MTLPDNTCLKDFMKSRFALGLVLLTSVAATAFTITQASASSAQLKEGEWISEIDSSGTKSTHSMCYDRETLSSFLAGLAYGADKNEVVIHSSTQFEVSSKFHLTSNPDDGTSIHYNFKYNGPCKKEDKEGDMSIILKDESGQKAAVKLNSEDFSDYADKYTKSYPEK